MLMKEYQADIKERLRLKEQYKSNGIGVSSSRKLIMDKPMSKGTANQMKSPIRENKRDEEDVIESPDVSSDEKEVERRPV